MYVDNGKNYAELSAYNVKLITNKQLIVKIKYCDYANEALNALSSQFRFIKSITCSCSI